MFLIRSAKFRERIDAAVDSAQRASKYALQKADIAISRTATARGKAELADVSADHARVDSEIAIQTAREFAPDFKPSLLERFERIRVRERFRNTTVNDNDPNNISGGVGGAKTKLLNDNQTANNIASPNKQASLSQQSQSLQQQQSLLNPQVPARRTSVNPNASMMRQQQSSLDYTMQNSTSMYANKTSNSVDYSNNTSLGLNQQFSQPQPPGSGSAFSTPQKLSQNNANSMQQQQQYSQPASNISTQQSQQQHNQQQQQHYSQQQSSASHYQSTTSQDNMNSYNNYQQQPQQSSHNNYNNDHHAGASSSSSSAAAYANDQPQRRSSRQTSDSGRPMLGAIHQTSIDHFDHYKRPPSRDSSVDRYTRAASRMGASRQPSVDRQITTTATIGGNPSTSNLTPEISIDRNVRAGSQLRGTTPAPTNINGSVLTGVLGGGIGSNSASRRGSRSGTPVFQQQQSSLATIQAQYSTPNQPFEDILLRQRTLGQDIIPSPGQPKRTESLFVPPKPMGGGSGSAGISSMMMGGGGGGGVSRAANKVRIHKHMSIVSLLSRKLQFIEIPE